MITGSPWLVFKVTLPKPHYVYTFSFMFSYNYPNCFSKSFCSYSCTELGVFIRKCIIISIIWNVITRQYRLGYLIYLSARHELNRAKPMYTEISSLEAVYQIHPWDGSSARHLGVTCNDLASHTRAGADVWRLTYCNTPHSNMLWLITDMGLSLITSWEFQDRAF